MILPYLPVYQELVGLQNTLNAERSKVIDLVRLSRAFLYAGVPSVVTTLWPIDDEASRTLMVAFYEKLRSGLTVAEALRQAQIETLAHADTHFPYYWAAFTLTGDYLGNE